VVSTLGRWHAGQRAAFSSTSVMGGPSMRALLILLTVVVLASCGPDEEESKDQETTTEASALGMTTIGALNVELPFPVPGEIPAPTDAKYIGENKGAAPYNSAMFSTAMTPEALQAELRAFATAKGARYDPAIHQVIYTTELEGAKHNVYAWARTLDGKTVLEIGTIKVPQ
jgi:hypothetical protein